MQPRTTVRLVTNDPILFRKAAVTLAEADYHVLADTPGDGGNPDLVLRHWADTDWRSHPDPVPVLTLDLGTVSGEDLVRVVERVLGHRTGRTCAPQVLGQLLAEFRSAEPSWYARSGSDWRTQN